MPNSDQQLAAFAAHSFDSDARWREYWNNLTIPPERMSDPAVIRRYRQKYYTRYIDSTFVVDPLPATSTSSSTAASTDSRSNPSSTSTTSAAPRSTSVPQPRPQPRASNRSAPGPPGNLLDLRTAVFLANAWVVVVSAIAMLPISPRLLAARSFRLSLVGAVIASVLSIVQKYGLPTALSLDAAKTWLQRAIAGPEILNFMHAMIFFPASVPLGLGLLPLAVRAVLPASSFLQQNFRAAPLYRQYLARPCDWLSTNTPRVELFAANSEILLGPLLIFYLLTPQRSFIMAFLYWQLLRMKYHAPATSWYHRQIWEQLGQRVEPILHRFAPFLLPVLGYAKTWFTAVDR